MQNEIISKMLASQNKTMSEQFATPPSGTTVVMESSTAVPSTQDLPPGSPLPGARWVPYTKEYVDTHFPKVTLVPYPIPNMVWPERDEEGRQKIRIIKQDLECWLTCGEENIVSEFFADEYYVSYKNWKELEKFKRMGGPGSWNHGGEHGENTWTMITDVISFGMDEDGRPLNIDRSIWEGIPDDQAGLA